MSAANLKLFTLFDLLESAPLPAIVNLATKDKTKAIIGKRDILYYDNINDKYYLQPAIVGGGQRKPIVIIE